MKISRVRYPVNIFLTPSEKAEVDAFFERNDDAKKGKTMAFLLVNFVRDTKHIGVRALLPDHQEAVQ